MAKFSNTSLERLSTIHPDLQHLLMNLILEVDFTIICGHRGKEEQERAFVDGRTKKHWPNSKHNAFPSKAVDLAPYPLDWEEARRFYYFAGQIMTKAKQLGLKIRWGGDWDGDLDFKDNDDFNDLPHFELVD